MENKKTPKKLFVIFGIVILLAAIGYLFIYLPHKENVNEGETLIREADKYVEEMEYVDAVDIYKEVEDLDPGNYKSYLGLAQVYLLKNRKDNAIEILQVGANKARNKNEIYELLGQIYLEDGDYSKSIHFLEKSKSLDSSKILLSQAYIAAGDLTKAKNILNISDKNYELYVKGNFIKAMLSVTDVDDAKDLIDDLDLTKVDDDLADQVELLKEVFKDINDLDDDARLDVYLSVMVSRVALYSGYPDIVIGLLSSYLEEYELYWELNLYIGHAYLLKSNYEKALEFLSEAYVLENDSAEGARLLARAYLGNNNVSEMIKYYEKAINLENDEKTETRQEYLEVLIRTEQYARAEEQMDLLLISDNIDEDSLRLYWGACLLDRELYSQLDDLLSDLDIDKLEEDLKDDYYFLKTGLSYGSGDWSDAKGFINQAIENNPLEAKYYLLYGKILYQTSEDLDASEQLLRAIELDLGGEVSEEAKVILDRI